ncbi:MAG: GNAT family N-acetyltransferase [Pseudonocardiales bacterium]|nr:MAG: GNAT family N-acetyltransferase [Pseudonocardiales bacterium]
MIRIAKLSPNDRDTWESLFRAYIAFYERTEPQHMYDRAWTELQADDRIHALGASVDGQLVGITHFLVHASTSSRDVCYLQDLYTAPAARGHGVARALIDAVVEWASGQDCDRVYWSTQQTNTTARRLYDQVAENRGFILYRIQL